MYDCWSLSRAFNLTLCSSFPKHGDLLFQLQKLLHPLLFCLYLRVILSLGGLSCRGLSRTHFQSRLLCIGLVDNVLIWPRVLSDQFVWDVLFETVPQRIRPLLRLLMVAWILLDLLLSLLFHCIDMHLILNDFVPLILVDLLILVRDQLISLETVIIKIFLAKPWLLTTMVAREIVTSCLLNLVALVSNLRLYLRLTRGNLAIWVKVFISTETWRWLFFLSL